MTNYDIGRLTSGPLTEVRTVLSRAETALAALDRDRSEYGTMYEELEIVPVEGHHEPYGEPIKGWVGTPLYQPQRWVVDKPAVVIPHPDLEEMRDALRTTINVLRKWERTGAKRRSK
jgi:hypothetical protein